MPKKYKCQLFMAHTEQFAQTLLSSEYRVLGEELMDRLYRDQHDLYHDGEYADGCDICDKEREEACQA